MKMIAVIAEVFEHRIQPVTWEVLAAAKRVAVLKGRSNQDVVLIVPSEAPSDIAEDAARCAQCQVVALEVPGLKTYISPIYIEALGRYLEGENISHVLVAHTAQGRDFGPGLSVRISAQSFAGVTDIREEDKELTYVRPVHNSEKQLCLKMIGDGPVLLSILPGHFTGDTTSRQGGWVDNKIMVPNPSSFHRVRHKGIRTRYTRNKALKEARVVVSAGRGIGSIENLEEVERLCRSLPNAVLGASRPLVDMKWIGYEHQVGITGASVSPDLYVACGISGSSQHIAGMRQAKTVIAINHHPDAPIFRHADICIIEEVIPFLRETSDLLCADEAFNDDLK